MPCCGGLPALLQYVICHIIAMNGTSTITDHEDQLHMYYVYSYIHLFWINAFMTAVEVSNTTTYTATYSHVGVQIAGLLLFHKGYNDVIL